MNGNLKSYALRGTFESEKLSLFQKSGLVLLLSTALVTSWFDELGVVKHIWLAAFGAVAVFELYRRFILPKMTSQMVTSSNFRANTYMIVFTYILSCTSGAGLLTAVLNLTGISAAILLINPILPKLYYPSLLLFGSVAFVFLAGFRALNPFLSIPVALILASASIYLFKRVKSDEFIEEDIESSSMLPSLPKEKPSIFNGKELLKTSLALLISGIFGFVLFYWIMLSINPFWMRAERVSKYETLHRLPHDVNLRVREVSTLDDLKFYKSQLNKFPVVIKPSICTTSSRNVMKCSDYACLEKYLKERIARGPLNDGRNGDKGAWVIQEYAPNLEGVVFYYKLPYMSTGSIKNIGIRDESIKGNQKSENTSLQAQYWPDTFRTDFSPQILKFFNDLAAKIPGYTGGRFDIMLPSDELKDPRGINVLELNVFFLGCIEEKTIRSVWDEVKMLRTSLMQIYIGIVNIVAGYNFLNFWGIAWKVPELVSRAILCRNHEHLFAKP